GFGDSGFISLDADEEAFMDDPEEPWDEPNDGDWDDPDESVSPGGRGFSINPWARQPQPAPTRPSRKLGWKQHLSGLRGENRPAHDPLQPGAWPPGREILYVVDVPVSLQGKGLSLELAHRYRKKDG